eukprot:TRINITY_DN38169_c0_g1_i1.p1 TRINITY_DN38169_c0_g1~~TRINITY_DN38169_c0_g1_i1.p1  ORF type:complete len:722 (-),score=152.00 TRINITY_DN38169_c0_g1_i1:83-2248(-)
MFSNMSMPSTLWRAKTKIMGPGRIPNDPLEPIRAEITEYESILNLYGNVSTAVQTAVESLTMAPKGMLEPLQKFYAPDPTGSLHAKRFSDHVTSFESRVKDSNAQLEQLRHMLQDAHRINEDVKKSFLARDKAWETERHYQSKLDGVRATVQKQGSANDKLMEKLQRNEEKHRESEASFADATDVTAKMAQGVLAKRFQKCGEMLAKLCKYYADAFDGADVLVKEMSDLHKNLREPTAVEAMAQRGHELASAAKGRVTGWMSGVREKLGGGGGPSPTSIRSMSEDDDISGFPEHRRDSMMSAVSSNGADSSPSYGGRRAHVHIHELKEDNAGTSPVGLGGSDRLGGFGSLSAATASAMASHKAESPTASPKSRHRGAPKELTSDDLFPGAGDGRWSSEATPSQSSRQLPVNSRRESKERSAGTGSFGLAGLAAPPESSKSRRSHKDSDARERRSSHERRSSRRSSRETQGISDTSPFGDGGCVGFDARSGSGSGSAWGNSCGGGSGSCSGGNSYGGGGFGFGDTAGFPPQPAAVPASNSGSFAWPGPSPQSPLLQSQPPSQRQSPFFSGGSQPQSPGMGPGAGPFGHHPLHGSQGGGPGSQPQSPGMGNTPSAFGQFAGAGGHAGPFGGSPNAAPSPWSSAGGSSLPPKGPGMCPPPPHHAMAMQSPQNAMQPRGHNQAGLGYGSGSFGAAYASAQAHGQQGLGSSRSGPWGPAPSPWGSA